VDLAARRRRRLVGVVIGALAAAAIVVGIVVATTGGDSPIDSVIDAPDTQVLASDVIGGGTAIVHVSASQDAGVIELADLPTPPAGRTYELWLLFDDSGPRPAGTFDPGAGGDVTRLVPDAPDAAGIAITIEPSAGSDSPTTTPILAITWK
jgi:anti-sigma-K factor RskA